MKQIPNIFTLLNLLLGCMAIVFALQNVIVIDFNSSDGCKLSYNPERLAYAALFIYAAALVDFLDGFVARLFNAASPLGKQLDSLADVVSFGVAPGVILYQLLRLAYMKQENGLDVAAGWLWPAFLVSMAAAYRLGKFNLDESQAYGFKGVPTPAVGLLIASFPLILHYGGGLLEIDFLFTDKWFLYAIIVLVSWLMVSNLPLMALKFKDFSLKNNLPKYTLAGIALVAALLLKWMAVPVVFIAYLIVSLTQKQSHQ
jgi:CDP-diacylglycerol---serine O-phosphatidyltransferase